MTQRVQIVICCLAVGLLLGPACSPDRPSGDQEELAWEAIGIRDYTPSADQKRFDVAHYGLVLTLDLEASAVSGRLSVRGKKEKSLDVLELDLYDNMKVQRVSSGKGDLKFGRSRRHKLRIALPDAGAETFDVTVEFEGRPYRILSNSDWTCGLRFDRIGDRPVVCTCFQPFFARSLFPCKDHPSDKAEEGVDITVTVPKPLVVVATGRRIGKSETAEGRTFRWRSRYPVATNLISFSAAEYVEIRGKHETEDGGKLLLQYFVLPQNEARARKAFQEVPRLLKTYERFFGPFPFVEDKYCLVETSYCGLENQTAIGYGSEFPEEAPGRGEYDYTLVHETAHEWAGNAVTCSDWRHIWLHEGLATYAEGLYLEARDGRDAYLDLARSSWLWNAGDEALTARDVNSDRDIFESSISYSRGAAVFHMLRFVVGDKAFLEGLKSYFTDPARRYGNADTAAFRRVMEAASGRNLEAFFKAWVHGAGRFDCEYDVAREGEKVTVAVRSVSGRPVPHRLPMIIRLEQDGRHLDRKVRIGPVGTSCRIPLVGRGEWRVVFDPEGWLLKGEVERRPGLIQEMERK